MFVPGPAGGSIQVGMMIACALVLSACSGEGPGGNSGIMPEITAAREIALRYPIVDTHIDVPYWLERNDLDVGEDVGTAGEFDHPKAVAGGLDGAFMSIYIPASVDAAGQGWPLALKLITGVEGIVRRHPDKFALATDPEDVLKNKAKGLVSLPMGMENGGPLSENLDLYLAEIHRRGVRYVGPAHSRSNAFADSSYDINEQWQGLSPAGRELIRKLNDFGIMIDVSHLSDKAFYQVLAITAVPVIASHSSARHFIPGFHRNLDDDAIRALARNGGVVQINFGSTFISAASRKSSEEARFAFQKYLQETGVARDSEEALAWRADYDEREPFRFAELGEVLDHFDHVVKLVGVEHVGIGSDFNGVGDTLPTDLKDVSQFPNLVQGLLQRGYSERDIAKMLGGNLLRVWSAVRDHARRGS